MEAEDANFSLFNYVNEVNAEVEKLEDQIGDIKVWGLAILLNRDQSWRLG